MKIVITDLPTGMSPQMQHWIYNGLDAVNTVAIASKLRDKVASSPAYISSMAVAPIALAMMRRGVQIDVETRDRIQQEYEKKFDELLAKWHRFCFGVYGRTFNYNSPNDIAMLFHTFMATPRHFVHDKKTNKKRPSVNEEALVKFQSYYWSELPAKFVLALRGYKKIFEVLEMKLSPALRAHCSYNSVGTVSGRWSSSTGVFKTGGNLQNVTEELREMFIADTGELLGSYDLEQVDSRFVAYISGDANYIAACESGDLHTTCCRWLWPKLPWTGDIQKDKKIANDTIFFRHFSHRDMSKRAGHATNYYAVPTTLADRLKLPIEIAKEFQEIYYDKFPGIRTWQDGVITQIQSTATLTNPFGRVRHFYDRLDAASTHREAISWGPQSATADLLNRVMKQIADRFDPHLLRILLQIHDAFVFTTPHNPNEVHRQLAPHLSCPVVINHRTLIVPFEAKYGHNWRKRVVNKDGSIINPRGLGSWKLETGSTTS